MLPDCWRKCRKGLLGLLLHLLWFARIRASAGWEVAKISGNCSAYLFIHFADCSSSCFSCEPKKLYLNRNPKCSECSSFVLRFWIWCCRSLQILCICQVDMAETAKLFRRPNKCRFGRFWGAIFPLTRERKSSRHRLKVQKLWKTTNKCKIQISTVGFWIVELLNCRKTKLNTCFWRPPLR